MAFGLKTIDITSHADKANIKQAATAATWWNESPFLKETSGAKTSESFYYSSENNTWWLSDKEFSSLLESATIEL